MLKLGIRIFFCHILTLMTFSQVDGQSNEEWNLEKDENGVKVFTRLSSEGYLDEYKGVTNVSADLEELLTFICEVSKAPEWGYRIQESKIIERVNENEFFVHVKADAPWPVSDRDMVYRFKVTKPNEQTYRCEMINTPNKIPPLDNYVRIPRMKGFWELSLQADNTIRVTQQVLSDPGGTLPLWLANMVVVTGPYTTLANLRKLYPSS